ncbi:MAG: adaptor protein MecA [Lachnospiraceae bacterium]|nr:adaptor protein MecA [Lachnospiraceae bacterium]
MKFKRIDVDTVRCIITEDELGENGLQLEDFLQNDGKTESFLRKLISMAETEVGYKVQGGNVSIQVTVLPEHTLALTFSEKPAYGITDMLANLRAAVENLTRHTPQSGQEDETDRNSRKAEFTEERKDDTVQEKQPSDRLDSDRAERERENSDTQESKDLVLNGRSAYQLRFASLDMAMRYAKGIVLEVPIHTQLYYLEREAAYYLLMERGGMEDKQVCRLLSASLEFSQEIYAHEPTRAFIREHGRCILAEQAVEHLQEL